MRKHLRISIALLALLFGSANSVLAAPVDESPGAGAMTLDLVVARPIGLVMFGLGSVTYVATLPFSLLGGNAGDAGKALVVGPAEAVFVRCLGCRAPGRKSKNPE